MTSDDVRSQGSGDFVQWAAEVRDHLGDRSDLVDRLDVATARVSRAATVVAVVGEFKQGKSALINSLLGSAVCPVDDHVATSRVTVVSHGDAPAVIVRRRDEHGRLVAEAADPARRNALLTERPDVPAAGVAGDGDIERVDLVLPNALLAEGIVVVDTPGVGGLTPAHAAATRAFLGVADAVVFVTDATSELTGTELSFLREIADVCPHVVVALTKIDLFAGWRRVAELDREHLATAGIAAPLYPVSYPLRVEAIRGGADSATHGDDVGRSESGYPELLTHIRHTVVPTAREQAERRSIAEITGLLAATTETDRRELAVLVDPDRNDPDLAELHAARERLEGLASGGAKWKTVLNDSVTDVTQEVTFGFRDRMRQALDELEQAVDDADDADELDRAVELLKVRVADAVETGFREIQAGVDQVTTTVAAALGLDELPIDAFDPVEVTSAAVAAAFDDDGDDSTSLGGEVFSALRGAQGGVLMIAVMGSLLPAAAAATVAAAPFMIGAGVLFGGKSIVDVRSQRRQRDRQRVKVVARKGVDDVQFRVGNQLGAALKSAQRHLRDELGERIDELHRTTTDTIGRLERLVERDADERGARRSALTDRVARADELSRGPWR